MIAVVYTNLTKEVTDMEIEAERYRGVVYEDNIFRQEPVMTELLAGNIQPMIVEISENQYNHLEFVLSANNISDKLTKINTLIDKIPSVTHFAIHAPINSYQASMLVHPMAKSNIYEYEISSDHLRRQGIPELINALSESNIKALNISGYTEEDTLAAIHFYQTQLKEFNLYTNFISENAYLEIFNNLHNSSINTVTLAAEYYSPLSSETSKQINLSQTNLSYLSLSNIYFEADALKDFKFANSSISKLSLETPELSAEDLDVLSLNLADSQIKELFLGTNEGLNEVAHLELSNSPVETLDLKIDGINLPQLHLEGSKVTTLDLSSNGITDQQLCGLNLKNTAIQHLILDYNDISEQGIEILKNIIKDTSVIDVSVNTMHFNWVDGGSVLDYKEVLVVNDHLKPAEKSALISLSDVFAENEHTFEPYQTSLAPSTLKLPVLSFDHLGIVEML